MIPYAFAFPPPKGHPQILRYKDAVAGQEESRVLLVNRPLTGGVHDDTKIPPLLERGGYLVGINAFETWPARLHNRADNLPLRNYDLFEQPYYRSFIGFLHNHREPRDVFPDDIPLLRMDFSDYVQVRKKGREKVYDIVCYAGHRPKDGNEKGVRWGRSVKEHDLAVEVLRKLLDLHPDLRVAMVNDPTEIQDPRVTHFEFLGYREFLDKVEESRIMLVASVLDASPRVLAEAMCLDTYIMVNERISGGWKYVNPVTGAFFNERNYAEVYQHLRARGPAGSRGWFTRNYANHILEARFSAWVHRCILAYSAFNRFGRVYYLDRDDSEAGRLAMVRELFRHMGIYGDVVERLPAVDTLGDPATNRARRHLDALRRAQALGLSDVVLFEDDYQFIVPRKVANRKLEELFEGFPDWDVVLLGNRGIQEDEPTHDPAVMRVRETATPHGYLVNARVYERLIAALQAACDEPNGTGERGFAGFARSANVYAMRSPLGD